jgi:pimeloyl-ACP methyl ester carboxylesterase
MRKIKNGQHTVYYQLINKNAKKTVVFIHGLFSTSAIFRHFVKKSNKNVILVELRGIVYSKVKKPFLDNYIEDLRLILKKEKIKKVTLVGYSLGCSIANHFAERFSETVEKVILLGPVNRTFREIGKKQLLKTLTEGLGKDFFKKWKNYLSLEKNCAKWKIFGLFNFRLLKDAYRKIDFTRKCPVVILNGKNDTFFNFQDKQLELPHVIHEVIEGLDHFLFLSSERIEKITQPLLVHI